MGFDPSRVRAVWESGLGRWLGQLPIRYFNATLEGTEHVPAEGGALVVGNHGMFGLDGFVLGALLVRNTNRIPRFLGERNLWRFPPVARFLDEVGALPGEPEAATKLLEEGELVVVYPGGIDDSFKSSEHKYELQWGKRAGFARIAMRAKVPIVPVAGLGIDEMYTLVGRERWLGRALLGSARYDLPFVLGRWGTPLPRRAPQRYVLLPPVDTRGDPDKPEDLERVRKATHDVLDAALAGSRA